MVSVANLKVLIIYGSARFQTVSVVLLQKRLVEYIFKLWRHLKNHLRYQFNLRYLTCDFSAPYQFHTGLSRNDLLECLLGEPTIYNISRLLKLAAVKQTVRHICDKIGNVIKNKQQKLSLQLNSSAQTLLNFSNATKESFCWLFWQNESIKRKKGGYYCFASGTRFMREIFVYLNYTFLRTGLNLRFTATGSNSVMFFSKLDTSLVQLNGIAYVVASKIWKNWLCKTLGSLKIFYSVE